MKSIILNFNQNKFTFRVFSKHIYTIILIKLIFLIALVLEGFLTTLLNEKIIIRKLLESESNQEDEFDKYTLYTLRTLS